MAIEWGSLFLSVLVLVAVAFASETSPTLAAVCATAPFGTILSFYILSSSTSASYSAASASAAGTASGSAATAAASAAAAASAHQATLVDFSNRVTMGILASLVFALACGACLRSGMGLGRSLVAAAVVWFAATATLHRLA
jgi:hypothetical protein